MKVENLTVLYQRDENGKTILRRECRNLKFFVNEVAQIINSERKILTKKRITEILSFDPSNLNFYLKDHNAEIQSIIYESCF